jgi:hypothetical protein
MKSLRFLRVALTFVTLLPALNSSDAATTWTTVAAENQTFVVSGTQVARYGTGNAWIEKLVTGTIACSNAAFGSDPDFGIVKECQTAPSANGWAEIAVEGAIFEVDGAQSVRFGSGTNWVTKTVSGKVECTNASFGRDPAFGSVKECDLGGGTVVSTPPSASPPVAQVCTPPITAANLSSTDATVGNGTPSSCTESALRAAVAGHAVVTFNCGAAPATIRVTSPITVPPTRNSVIDGGNRITLDGGGATRILSIVQENYRTNANGLTLQHIALHNAKAPGGGYVPPNASNPSCSYGYATGAGAAVEVRDASLHVIDVDFTNNAAATPGPDVGGGAIFAMGSLDVVISGSRFTGNSGSNSGAVGMLNSNLRVYNSSFQNNMASGTGRNYQSATVANCPGVGQPGQGGAGGNAGAIGIDGGDDTDVVVCGSTFTGNHANELAGALGRTADGAARRTTLDRDTFAGNTAGQAGAVFVINSKPLDILASTFSGNRATSFGAAQLSGSQFNIVNSTFSGNEATRGVGGALFANGNAATSVIQNATFADNKASGGAGYFSAALFGDSNFPILNTVFSNNTTSDAYNPMQCSFNSSSGTADLQWPRFRATGNLQDTPCVVGIAFADPSLGILANNSGPTLTRQPAQNSPLRKAGRNCPGTDQRGIARNVASCTIGAVE